MTFNSRRSPDVLIKELQLLSASNDFVQSFYLSKFKEDGGIDASDIDEVVELKLLEKGEAFIDITLAQFCLYDGTLMSIFSKSKETKNLALRFACLNNRSVGRRNWSIDKLPLCLFGGKKSLLAEYLNEASNDELGELFSNETVCDNFIADLISERDDLWSSISDEKQRVIILSLCQNNRVSSPYEGPMDGYAEYLHGRLFSCLWDLSKKVPVSVGWAIALGLLYEKVKNERFKFDSFEVAKRWDEEGGSGVEFDPKEGLSEFGVVRSHIYRDVIKDLWGKDRSNREHLENSDRAYRACAYRVLYRLSVDDIKRAYELDGVVAVEFFLENRNIWQNRELRSALKDICWDSDSRFNDNHLYGANDYKYREERFRETNPDWFDESGEEEVDDDDKVLTVGEARRLLEESSQSKFSFVHKIVTSRDGDGKFGSWSFYLLIVIALISFFK